MKTTGVVTMVLLSLLMLGRTPIYAQQSRSEVPGDHFSLEGALELFKKSSSPEEFERMLNSPNSEVNNLDLNGDGDIDYIKVIDRNEGNVHAFILQAIISEREGQDVAVIELEKLANGKAVLQITGDADIYGIETIIEPTEEVRINAGTGTARNIVNVWTWPSVQYVYSPYYYGWMSPWSWNYWPTWWSPWRPVTYVAYYPRWVSYRPYYSSCYTHRVIYAQQIYRPYRNTSVIVYNRHHTQITNYRSSRNDSFYSRDRDHAGRQHRDMNDRSSYDRQRPVTTQPGNINSSSNDRGRNNNQSNRGRSSATRDESSYGDQSTNDGNRKPASWQRNSGSIQSQETERGSGFVNPNGGSRQKDGSSFGNRTSNDPNRLPSGSQRNSNGISSQDSERKYGLVSPDQGTWQRDGSSIGNRSSNDIDRSSSGRQTFGNTNNGSREREVRPSLDRGSQRSTVQTERRGSSESSTIQRSGNDRGGNSNKSIDQRRGRD